MLEITNEVISETHQAITVPSLIILFAGVFLIFLIVGMIFAPNSRPRFMMIWFVSLIVSALLLAFLVFFEHTTQLLIEFFVS